MCLVLQVVRKPEEGDFIGHLRAEALMEIARIFQVSPVLCMANSVVAMRAFSAL